MGSLFPSVPTPCLGRRRGKRQISPINAKWSYLEIALATSFCTFEFTTGALGKFKPFTRVAFYWQKNDGTNCFVTRKQFRFSAYNSKFQEPGPSMLWYGENHTKSSLAYAPIHAIRNAHNFWLNASTGSVQVLFLTFT